MEKAEFTVGRHNQPSQSGTEGNRMVCAAEVASQWSTYKGGARGNGEGRGGGTKDVAVC